MTAHAVKPMTLHEQACTLRTDLPELFNYLNARDEMLRHALRRVPTPADIELSATWNHCTHFGAGSPTPWPGIHTLVSER